ncbi:DUF445 family protein [Staphylococcus simulans]|uniref:DUF445 domain-containing protein n=1 Tax=Staphylococcus TaxID=1279 RepID=UPI0007642780|nr:MULTISPECIES: DUF445 family protein [Staphylococcus]KXA40938.1 hypothetical protein HMPREF3215_02673 [Staphylococcus simulans]MCE5023855.1 DUF445 domain-containing protein [Staphylococcus simulans]MDK7926768.1 DUF445 family protein [Staphylococcus simulans]MDK8315387.1 DUF445 family protein [Staphylococcus simulans]MDQ7112198.1 DUF445 family protein [Staphylococcus simulans]
MHAFFVILFMIVIGAIIGGVTNIIAIKMLFHPQKAYHIGKWRIPFTPGLVPKRREEIANKIGRVIEEHLITEALIKEKISSASARQAIEGFISQQINKLSSDRATLQNFAQSLDIDFETAAQQKVQQLIEDKLQQYYQEHGQSELRTLIPEALEAEIDEKVESLTPLLCDRARIYLSSQKGEQDIYNMLDTFFEEKGKIVGLLEMFMTRASIAERIQVELIRLTNHPKARQIAAQLIRNEYQTLKGKHLNQVLSQAQFTNIKDKMTPIMMAYIDIPHKANQPISELAPGLVQYAQAHAASFITDLIVNKAAEHISSIMKQVNLSAIVEEQINSFDLDYIERLIIEIANKELKLIMMLGFLLGGIIGCFQGIIALFV